MSGVHAADVARTACSGRSRCHRPAQHSAHVPDASERIACSHAVRRGDDGSSSRSAAIDSRSASESARRGARCTRRRSAARRATPAPPRRSRRARGRTRSRAAARTAARGGGSPRRPGRRRAARWRKFFRRADPGGSADVVDVQMVIAVRRARCAQPSARPHQEFLGDRASRELRELLQRRFEADRRDATTRAPQAAARAAAQLIELPADALGLVLYQLPLAHDIAATGADVPRALRRCEARAQVAAVHRRGRDAAWAR